MIMRVGFAVGVAAVSVLLACAHSGGAPEPEKVFNKKGGLVFLGGSASWDEDEVVGPLVSVSRRGDGSWAGNIVGTPVDVSLYNGRAAGSNLVMKWTDEGDHRVITAQLNNRIHRFEVYPDRVLVRGPSRSFTLSHRGDWTFGPGSELKFEGEAQSMQPPMPQFGIAMLATFAAAEGAGRDSQGDPSMPYTGPQG